MDPAPQFCDAIRQEVDQEWVDPQVRRRTFKVKVTFRGHDDLEGSRWPSELKVTECTNVRADVGIF